MLGHRLAICAAFFPYVLSAGSLVVEVHDPQGAALEDAVIYCSPEGKNPGAAAGMAIMDQKNKTFVPHVLPVQVGTSVKFPNSDDIQHHVYSFSPAKKFELPLYKGTPANPIVFDTPGVVTLGCNIHDKMNAYIVVLDTPYFEKTEASGRVEFTNLPPGKYTIHAWQPDESQEPDVQTVTIGEADSPTLTFTIKPAPAALSSAPLNKLEDKFKKYSGNGRP
jgi:plastocyanin